MARMAFLVDDLHRGGSELFLRDLVLSLRQDQEVHVIGLFAGGPIGEELAREGVPLTVLGLRKWNLPWKFFSLLSLLTSKGIQVLHCERLASAIFGVFAGRSAGVEDVVIRRGSLPWWPSPLYRRLDRRAMKGCDGIITASEAIRDGFIEEFGLPAEKFHVIPHGLARPGVPSPSARGDGGDSSKPPVVGCVANFNWRKDHEILLQAFRAVAREIPGVRLKLVGAGPLEVDLRERVGTFDVRDQVDFLGSRSDVPDLLREFDVLVLPSRTEGFGRVLLEAMAAEVPVVATAVGGIPEVITNDLTGILVRPESPEAMAGAVLHILREPGEARRLGTNARRDVADRFSIDSVVARYREAVGLDPAPETGGAEGGNNLEKISCPLCDEKWHRPITHRPDGMQVVRCTACHLLFLNPRPGEEALAALYTKEYFEGDGEFGWMKGYLESEMADLEGPGGYWQGILRKLEERLGKKGKVLDIGCSGGFFLEQARRDGWEGRGVEVSEAMVAFAREKFGHENIHHGTLHGAHLDDQAFDAVLLHNLIEHVVDPVGLLEEVRRVLQRDGVVCLTTPNAAAAGILGGVWSGFQAHFGHVTFFTRKTLERLLGEAGFKPVHWESQDTILSCGTTRGLKKVMTSERTPEALRSLLDFSRTSWRAANRAFFGVANAFGFSQNMLVIAEKERPSTPGAE